MLKARHAEISRGQPEISSVAHFCKHNGTKCFSPTRRLSGGGEAEGVVWDYEGREVKCRSVLLNEEATNPNIVLQADKRRDYTQRQKVGRAYRLSGKKAQMNKSRHLGFSR